MHWLAYRLRQKLAGPQGPKAFEILLKTTKIRRKPIFQAPGPDPLPVRGSMCVGGSEEALGAFFGTLWPLGGASARFF